jgi:hypothetical protein
MFAKDFRSHFIILLLPMLIVGFMIDVAYSLQAHEHIEINWIAVVVIAVVLDVFFAWYQNRPKKDSEDKKE